MPNNLNISKPDRQINVGVILSGGETELLDVGPIDLIHGLSKKFLDPVPDYFIPSQLKNQAVDMKFLWVSEKGEEGRSRLTSGLTIVPTHSYENCPPLDIVIIGASNMDHKPTEVELAFVRKSYEDCAAFMTICGGIMVPLQAGLLKGKTVTGPRVMLPTLRQQAPDTTWLEKRWVKDEKLWTSGALLNGMDCMHAFAEEHWGGEGSLSNHLSKIGAWHGRDVDYKDVPWKV